MDSYQDAELRLLLDLRTKEWNKKLEQMKRELAAKDQQIEQEQKRAELMGYIARRQAEERGEIAPELMSFIQGTTVEEIEAAIDRAKAKTSSILEGVRQAHVPPGPAAIPQSQPQGGAQEPQQLTLEQLQAVEVGSPQHLAARAAFGLDRARGRGLFG